MKGFQFYFASLSLLPMTAFCAGLERTPQSVSAFLQGGNYAEASLNVIDPSISGIEKNRPDIWRS